jgi:predicted transcriptional regulator
LVRSGRTRSGDNIRGLLAEHLGITEARVAKYLKDHCAIRWVQLDDEAQLLAHFAIAMLRPALND